MGKELPEAGYSDLRDYISNNWTWVALRDPDGNEYTRVPISDVSASWSEGSDGRLSLNVQVSPGVAGLTDGDQVGASAVYKTETSSDPVSVDDIPLITVTEAIEYRHYIEVPQL